MTESGLATFRIEKERWIRFQQLAKDSNTNASKLIIGFIDACLDGRIDVNDYTIIETKSETSNSDLDKYLDKYLDAHIDKYLEGRIDVLMENNLSSRLDRLPIEERVRASMESFIAPMQLSIEEIETYTQSQFTAVREDLKKALSDRVTPDTIANPVQIEMNLPSAKPKPDGEPDWVTADNRRFYKKLANAPVLVGKVAEAIAQHPKDNTALAVSLVEMGLHKNDGTALDSSSMSRIKGVVERISH